MSIDVQGGNRRWVGRQRVSGSYIQSAYAVRGHLWRHHCTHVQRFFSLLFTLATGNHKPPLTRVHRHKRGVFLNSCQTLHNALNMIMAPTSRSKSMANPIDTAPWGAFDSWARAPKEKAQHEAEAASTMLTTKVGVQLRKKMPRILARISVLGLISMRPSCAPLSPCDSLAKSSLGSQHINLTSCGFLEDCVPFT